MYLRGPDRSHGAFHDQPQKLCNPGSDWIFKPLKTQEEEQGPQSSIENC